MFATTDDGRRVELSQDGSWVLCDKIQVTERNSFRKAAWGMSASEVKRTEPDASWEEHDNICLFESLLNNLNCLAIYIFIEDNLCRGKYLITQDFKNENNYISNYDQLKEILAKKYGSPSSDDEYWLNDLYQDSYQDWGSAVGMGHMSRYTIWRFSETEICLGLSGENYKCDLFIEYSSVHYAKLEKAKKDSDVLDMI
ncbi:TPA: hypothetical protein L4E92_003578 [Pseudomonas aeruginosa]|uniref:hypothetical protein n=1 Tax=Pseudomonas aeruginosa TaxID=287 RepID=UPI00290358D8|nr:hypothetical protein [Pseudomonas aeruginosa]MDU0697879.1 hypothetical protein [Pseudomonas aeruginosa]HBO1216230.1 hypothetical protein [Pseudomonas aeruginosa]